MKRKSKSSKQKIGGNNGEAEKEDHDTAWKAATEVPLLSQSVRRYAVYKVPQCEGKTKLRKLPLVIHIDPMLPLALNKTCRYCPYCDLLIVHQDELESLLAAIFSVHNPEIVGNDYLVIGTMDRPERKRGTQDQLPLKDLLEVLHDFKGVVTFKIVGGGWTPRE